MSLENELTEELRGTYEAVRKRGYIATYFLQMLEEHGGKETAKRLLAKSEPQADTSKLESEIDQLVYQLYGLTEEEIKIVEGK